MEDSIWNKMSDKQWQRLVNELDCKDEYSAIDAQTIMFWTLQLQFMQFSCFTLVGMLNEMVIEGTYVRNEYSRSVFKIRPNGADKQKDCLATHLALQLSDLA